MMKKRRSLILQESDWNKAQNMNISVSILTLSLHHCACFHVNEADDFTKGTSVSAKCLVAVKPTFCATNTKVFADEGCDAQLVLYCRHTYYCTSLCTMRLLNQNPLSVFWAHWRSQFSMKWLLVMRADGTIKGPDAGVFAGNLVTTTILE